MSFPCRFQMHMSVVPIPRDLIRLLQRSCKLWTCRRNVGIRNRSRHGQERREASTTTERQSNKNMCSLRLVLFPILAFQSKDSHKTKCVEGTNLHYCDSYQQFLTPIQPTRDSHFISGTNHESCRLGGSMNRRKGLLHNTFRLDSYKNRNK